MGRDGTSIDLFIREDRAYTGRSAFGQGAQWSPGLGFRWDTMSVYFHGSFALQCVEKHNAQNTLQRLLVSLERFIHVREIKREAYILAPGLIW